MATDLKTTNDHAANVVDRRLSREALGQLTGIADLDQVPAGDFLRNYERIMGVTFATLDNGALTAVREAYEAHATQARRPGQSLYGDDLADAVRDLLGLGD